MSKARPDHLKLGNVTYIYPVQSQAVGKLLYADGRDAGLRPQTQSVLDLLANSPDAIVTKSDIMESVWSDVSVTDDSLVQCIAEIRKVIGPQGHHLIKTLPKRGYMLVPNGDVESTPRANPRKPYFKLIALAACALIAIAVATFWKTSDTPVLAYKGQPPGPTVAIRDEPSIAVLPFEDLTGDERWARFGRGLSTEITHELARTKWLFVTAPETTQSRVGTDPIAAGRELGIRFVVSGTIQAEEDQVRIFARMSDTSTGQIVWSEIWNRPSEGLFAIQSEIMARVGSTLTGSFSGEIGKADLIRAKRKPTESLSAYEHFLIGAELKQTFEHENLRKAIWHLEQAVAIDPSFARAWVTLSTARVFFGDTLEDNQDIQRMLSQAQLDGMRALKEDPDDPDALWSSVMTIDLSRDKAKAKRNLLRAVEIAPNNADVLASVSWTGSGSGLLDGTALELILRAMELNPEHPDWYWVALGEAALYAEEYDMAVEALHKAPSMMVVEWDLAVLEYFRGNMEQAKVHAANYRKIAPGMTITEQFDGDTSQPRNQAEIAAGRALGIPFDASEL